jgi:hypothetical protein
VFWKIENRFYSQQKKIDTQINNKKKTTSRSYPVLEIPIEIYAVLTAVRCVDINNIENKTGILIL